MTNKPTLNTLINFVPENEIECEIFNINKNVLNKYFKDTKEYWNKGKFYLGGQILIEPNEEITFLKINNVREIQIQKDIDISACNSFEIASINQCKRDLNEIEIILNPSDMLIYRGCEIEHWRNKFEGNICAQVFLHYNDINGPFKLNNKYDNRPFLGCQKIQ